MSTPLPAGPRTPPAPRASGVLLVLVLGTLMASVDTTIVLLAFPTIASDLHASLTLVLWTILIYLLVTAVLTTQVGRIGDLFGRSRMYNMGFVIFTVGSALCGFAPTGDSLVAFRGVQAVGGSLLIANSSAIVADNIPGAGRGRAFGYLAMGWSVGAVLGIVLGGIITTFVSWRYIFFINVPIGIIATYWGLLHLKDASRVRARLDLPGMALLAAALSLVTYGATDLADSGLSLGNGVELALGLLLIVPFLLWERRAPSPVVDLKVLRNRLLASSLGAIFLQSLGYLSLSFLLIMYLQGVRGLSPLDAALLLLPAYLLMSVLAPLSGRLVDRTGPRVPATVGLLLMFAVVLSFTWLTPGTSLYLIAGVMSIAGLGAALFFPANITAVMSASTPQTYGSTSGLMRTLQNIGLVGSYVVSITVASLALSRELAFRIFAGTTSLVGGVSTGFVTGIHSSLYVMAGVLAAAAALSWLRGSEPAPQVLEAERGTGPISPPAGEAPRP